MSRKVVSILMGGALVVAGGLLLTKIASAHFVPQPLCDFMTSGGFVFEDGGGRDNFGAHGGCKENGPDAPFWGHVNYVDHNGYNGTVPYHANSTRITGYLCDPAYPNARDICGFVRTNAGENVRFRVRLVDNGEGTNAACKDEFGIKLANGYLVSTRPLADDGPGGGNVQFHKGNPSNVRPNPAPTEFEMCDDLTSEGLTPTQQGCPVNPDAEANCHF